MSQVINTNVLSLTAQRNLQTSQSELATSLQRLSSGLRINSAKDDAAGLAISERFTTQIRGLNQAIRNANDGISLAQTGEAALATVTDNLQRIRELAVQSVNATNSDTDRATLQQEVDQRLSEIDRIASQTSFNGRNVLDGTFGDALFQVGANVGQTISLALGTDASVRTSAVGAVATATSVDLTGVLTEGTAVTASTGDLGTFTGASETSGTDLAVFSLNLNDGTNNVDIDVSVAASGTLDAAALATQIQTDRTTIENAGFTIEGADATEIEAAITAGTFSFSRADGQNFTLTESVSGDGTFSATPTFANTTAGEITTTDGTPGTAGSPLEITELTIQFGDNDAISVAAGTYTTQQSFVDAINTALGSNGTASLDEATNVISITSGEAITIGGTDATTVFSAASFATAGNLGDTTVATVAGANNAIARVDAALSSVSELRSTFGAIQNRFESTIENLTTTTENLQASRSRILDADFAAETANLTRVQILQQAGISVLSQANVQPQNVLALLQ